MTERWKVLAPAALLLIIAAIHAFAVHESAASRWRVGGMGMYSEPHPNAREILFLRGDEVVRGRRVDNACPDGERLRERATTHPFSSHIEAFGRACVATDLTGWTAQVVVPRLDPETRTLTVEVLREVAW